MHVTVTGPQLPESVIKLVLEQVGGMGVGWQQWVNCRKGRVLPGAVNSNTLTFVTVTSDPTAGPQQLSQSKKQIRYRTPFAPCFAHPSTTLTPAVYCLLCCVGQVGKVLANGPTGRAQFVHSGGLAAVQQMGEAPGSKLKEAVEIINSCYPEEVVRYYSPSYSQQLLQKLESMAATAQPVS